MYVHDGLTRRRAPPVTFSNVDDPSSLSGRSPAGSREAPRQHGVKALAFVLVFTVAIVTLACLAPPRTAPWNQTAGNLRGFARLSSIFGLSRSQRKSQLPGRASREHTGPKLVRGAPWELLDHYLSEKKAGRFSCFSGEYFSHFSVVNDNFCDCRDGSDEPGTAACAGMQQPALAGFECAAGGDKAVHFAAVGDGICDCCDGEDEWDGLVTCVNTCDELTETPVQEESASKAGDFVVRRASEYDYPGT